jgi:hypothetical protein
MENKLTTEERVEYQNMKQFYQQYKEDALFYKSKHRSLIIYILKALPKKELINILADLKIVKQNYVTREVTEKENKP